MIIKMLFTSPTPDITGNIKVLWQEAFGDTDEFIDSYMESAYSAKACRCAIEDNRIAAALHLMDCSVKVEKYAYVYAAATSEAYRGRGIFRSLMRDTEEYLISEGYAGMILVPGDAGLAKMYEKLGFCPFEGLTGTTVLASGAEKTVLRRVNAAEYSEERQKHLPDGAVVMGDSMTAFLERYAELYAGDDFVFARVKAGDAFVAAEFFGNKSKMPSVLVSLGYACGRFYTQNGEKRAMYRRFTEGKAPSLLGACFDL